MARHGWPMGVLLLALLAAPACDGGAPGGEGVDTAVVEAAAPEGPHFRVQRPRVAEGDRFVVLEGQTDLANFVVGVVREGRVVESEAVATQEPVGVWRPFATRLQVPDGLRPTDEVVFSPAQGEVGPELRFHPLES